MGGDISLCYNATSTNTAEGIRFPKLSATVKDVCVAISPGSPSGRRAAQGGGAGWPVTEKVASLSVEVSLSETPHPNGSPTSWLSPCVGDTVVVVDVCMNG